MVFRFYALFLLEGYEWQTVPSKCYTIVTISAFPAIYKTPIKSDLEISWYYKLIVPSTANRVGVYIYAILLRA